MDIWVTREGTEIDVSEMADSHLRNAKRFVQRRIDELQDEENAGYQMACIVRGDAASYAVECGLRDISDALGNLHAWNKIFDTEIERRQKR